MSLSESFSFKTWLQSLKNSKDPILLNILNKAASDENFLSIIEDVVIPFFEAEYNENAVRKGHTGYLYPRIDNFEAKTDLCRLASDYVNLPEIQCRTFSNEIIKILLDIEILPFKREVHSELETAGVLAKAGFISVLQLMVVSSGNQYLKFLYFTCKFIISLVVLMLFLISLNQVINSRFDVVLTGLLVFTTFLMVRKFLKFYWARKFMEKRVQLLSKYECIRDEVATSSYDSKRIIEKLKDLEKEKGYVFSIVYSVLEIV